MKWLKDEEHNALKQKADNYNSIVQSILAKNEDLKEEDITLEVIEQALAGADTAGTDERIEQLQSEVTSLTTKVDNLTTERDQLQTMVDELSELPGGESVSKKKAKIETSAIERDDLLAYAVSKKGDTVAIAEKLKAEGWV